MIKKSLILSLAIALYACSAKEEKKNREVVVQEIEAISPSKALIQQSIIAHGGVLYDSAQYEFQFRDITYRFYNEGSNYRYEREGVIKADSIHDVLINGALNRIKNGEAQELSEEDAGKYAESINSVIYFATLPHKLADAAVISNLEEEISINDNAYQVIKITFKQEGGGTDFDDEYYYWINQETTEIDYLAYNYQVNGGGVRFRSAYNKRRVGGILFQDYVNYKAEVGTPLASLPVLWENEELEELSRIETENIVSLQNSSIR